MAKATRCNIQQHIQQHDVFYRRYSDAAPFVIIKIFMSNCNLTTHFLVVTVTDYSYSYFVIKLRKFFTCN